MKGKKKLGIIVGLVVCILIVIVCVGNMKAKAFPGKWEGENLESEFLMEIEEDYTVKITYDGQETKSYPGDCSFGKLTAQEGDTTISMKSAGKGKIQVEIIYGDNCEIFDCVKAK